MSQTVQTTFVGGVNPFIKAAAYAEASKGSSSLPSRSTQKTLYKYSLPTVSRKVREHMFDVGFVTVPTVAKLLGISFNEAKAKLVDMYRTGQLDYSKESQQFRLTLETTHLVATLRAQKL